jgi:predicted nucleic acid-binding protein
MADQITKCDVIKDSESNPIQYDVEYSVESGSDTNTFCVVVLASEMTDSTDTDEVKTKANVKAKAVKDAWVADLAIKTQADVAITGDVTLT